LETELNNLKKLNHPNIVRYFDHFTHEDNLVIATEYIDGKTLRIMINDQRAKNQSFSDEFICQIFFEIVSALSHFHSLNIIPCDLKPENILITKENQIKLIDFEISKLIETISKSKTTSAGTTVYMSPEMIDEQKYFSSTDIWSLDSIFYELISLTHPFSYKLTEYSISISKQEIPNFGSLKCSKQLKEIIQQMLCYDPNSRITITNIEQSPFFLQFKENIQNIPSENEFVKKENVQNQNISEQEKFQSNLSTVDSVQKNLQKTLTFSDEIKKIIQLWKKISFKCEYKKVKIAMNFKLLQMKKLFLFFL
jgi:serine/threonine protein kinase